MNRATALAMRDLHKKLMALNAEAFKMGRYDAAYHSLAAALDCAVGVEDDEAMALVEERAREQLVIIDRDDPAYQHSTESARKRTHESVYATLASQAHAKALMLQAGRTFKAHKTGWG